VSRVPLVEITVFTLGLRLFRSVTNSARSRNCSVSAMAETSNQKLLWDGRWPTSVSNVGRSIAEGFAYIERTFSVLNPHTRQLRLHDCSLNDTFSTRWVPTAMTAESEQYFQSRRSMARITGASARAAAAVAAAGARTAPPARRRTRAA
jgi:hypothetical protein